jgi:hypothetical protein
MSHDIVGAVIRARNYANQCREGAHYINELCDILEDLGCFEEYHIVNFHEENYNMQHPLHERLGKELLHCEVDDYFMNLGAPPRIGKYRVRPKIEVVNDGYIYEEFDARN